jgi:pantothenate kinase
LLGPGDKLQATGGGAHKYFDLFKEKLDIEMIKNDEMGSLVAGMVTIFNKVK